MKLKYTKEDFLFFLKQYYQKHNCSPMVSNCGTVEIPISYDSYLRRFGSWKLALEKANLPKTKKQKRIKLSDNQIIEEISNFYKQYNKNPKIEDLSISNQAIRDRFGNWSNAIIKAGLQPLTSPQQEFNCKVCNKTIIRDRSARRRNKNHFCSYSCASKYNQTCRIAHGLGYRRSKPEQFIEEALFKEFPNIEILFNSNKIIDLELDIYIPSLNLAFEINGIFHYNPIFGEEKLKKTQEIDKQKIIRCAEQNIKFWVIDISKIKQTDKIKKVQPYINQIINVINSILFKIN